jgi:glycosyltransferase involved in cell wall biosynthesis
MKVLHAPWVIAGISGVLARAQRDLGVEADSYAITPNAYGYAVDKRLNTHRSTRFQILQNALRFAWHYDVFHFYFNGSLLGSTLKDVPWLHRLRKQVFFHFCGCDLRDSKAVIAQYGTSACEHCWPMRCSPNREEAIAMAQKYARAAFVSTPDLVEFYEDAHLLLNPIDLTALDKILETLSLVAHPAHQTQEPVRIAHAPSDRILKGTKYILAAVEELRRAGYPVELVLIEKMTHQEAMRVCLEADLAIDQVLIGSYGQYAIEMMAMRKPVICYIRPDLELYYDKTLPIVRSTFKDLKQVLARLLDRRNSWHDLGHQGRAYVEKFHEAHVIARQALEVYRGYG